MPLDKLLHARRLDEQAPFGVQERQRFVLLVELALQLGRMLGDRLGPVFHLEDEDRRAGGGDDADDLQPAHHAYASGPLTPRSSGTPIAWKSSGAGRRAGALRGPEPRRARPRIGGDLSLARLDGAARQQLEGRRLGRSERRMARAARLAAPLLQEAFHDAVLQRMEGDDDEPAALAQHRLRGCKRLGELVQLAVDEDAERLKGARRRMDARCADRPGRRRDDLGQLSGALDGRLGALPLDGAGDAAGFVAPRRASR